MESAEQNNDVSESKPKIKLSLKKNLKTGKLEKKVEEVSPIDTETIAKEKWKPEHEASKTKFILKKKEAPKPTVGDNEGFNANAFDHEGHGPGTTRAPVRRSISIPQNAPTSGLPTDNLAKDSSTVNTPFKSHGQKVNAPKKPNRSSDAVGPSKRSSFAAANRPVAQNTEPEPSTDQSTENLTETTGITRDDQSVQQPNEPVIDNSVLKPDSHNPQSSPAKTPFSNKTKSGGHLTNVPFLNKGRSAQIPNQETNIDSSTQPTAPAQYTNPTPARPAARGGHFVGVTRVPFAKSGGGVPPPSDPDEPQTTVTGGERPKPPPAARRSLNLAGADASQSVTRGILKPADNSPVQHPVLQPISQVAGSQSVGPQTEEPKKESQKSIIVIAFVVFALISALGAAAVFLWISFANNTTAEEEANLPPIGEDVEPGTIESVNPLTERAIPQKINPIKRNDVVDYIQNNVKKPTAPKKVTKEKKIPRNKRIADFVDTLQINVVVDRAEDRRLIINNTIYPINGIVNRELGIRFVGIDDDSHELIFQDGRSVYYYKPY